jgi:hypothetical protein
VRFVPYRTALPADRCCFGTSPTQRQWLGRLKDGRAKAPQLTSNLLTWFCHVLPPLAIAISAGNWQTPLPNSSAPNTRGEATPVRHFQYPGLPSRDRLLHVMEFTPFSNDKDGFDFAGMGALNIDVMIRVTQSVTNIHQSYAVNTGWGNIDLDYPCSEGQGMITGN